MFIKKELCKCNSFFIITEMYSRINANFMHILTVLSKEF